MASFWAILFLILIFIEIITVNLVTIWFAIGSLVAFFVALFIDSLVVQVCCFIIISILTILLTKPLLKKFKLNKFIATNSDRYIGKVGNVTKRITSRENGQVKVLGTIWTAASNQTLEIGDEVVVLKIDGVKLIVKKEEK